LWRHEAARLGQSLISHYCFFSLKPASSFFSFSRQKIIQISYMALKKDSGNIRTKLELGTKSAFGAHKTSKYQLPQQQKCRKRECEIKSP
jgi:hypothetical protein